MKLINIIPICLFLRCTQATFLPKYAAPSIPRDAQDISPKNRIKWTRCNLGIPDLKDSEKAFECGNLTVPLDYTRKSDKRNMILNLIKLKATKKSPKGSIIVNFGGPGGSGVDGMLSQINTDLADSLFGGQYDIISFDPRGTGKTLVPPDGNDFERMSGELSKTVQNSPLFLAEQLLPEQLMNEAFDYMSTFTELFVTRDEEFREFRGTAFVARDVAEIATALGEGNRINYWGISYGTVLGQVLAGMFPGRIERMLLDGNLLADDYVKDLGLHGTRDAEEALYHFYDECMAAANNSCHSASKLPKERDDFLEALNRVFMVYTGVGGGLGSTKSLGLTRVFLQALYDIKGYFLLDKLIDTAWGGNASMLLQEAPDLAGFTTAWNPQFNIAHLAILCSDATFRAETIKEFKSHFSLYEGNRALDDPFYLSAMLEASPCSRWNIHAAEAINLTSLSRVETKNPILLVNGKYDPVTPLGNARKISARFPGSQVVVHKGVGHGITSHPSNCTQEIINRYFISGELPLEETTCEPDLSVFEMLDMSPGLTRKRKIPILL
ncbi:tripeptidyl aminopeptidase [Fusarium mundagurra]|uniref:Tripeptidyl aminopeptidase n=1 Tax=Fusarium mundagurra TaxID=1567541 RepID=A0A8H5YJY6_9HYPO|nr:tripeptidyl aminopeptidase [Fusarium mundagurra]